MLDYTNILIVLFTMAAVICVGGATLLFLRGRNNRTRRLLAGIMMAWGLIYVVRVAGMLLGYQELNFIRTDVADTLVLVSGNLYLIFLLLYPLEVVRPGWLDLKRTAILLLPYVSITLFYYIVLFLLDQKPLALDNMTQFWEHIGKFNVWYRLLMTLSIVAYLAFLFRLTWRYKSFYQQWCCNNYSDDENLNISWLRQYGIGVVLIGLPISGCFLTAVPTALSHTTSWYNVSFAILCTKGSFTTIHTQRVFSAIRWMKQMLAGKPNSSKNKRQQAILVVRRTKTHSSRNCPCIGMRSPAG